MYFLIGMEDPSLLVREIWRSSKLRIIMPLSLVKNTSDQRIENNMKYVQEANIAGHPWRFYVSVRCDSSEPNLSVITSVRRFSAYKANKIAMKMLVSYLCMTRKTRFLRLWMEPAAVEAKKIDEHLVRDVWFMGVPKF